MPKPRTPEQTEALRVALLARLRAGGDGAWLLLEEAATVLRVGRSTVDRMIRSGDIAYRVKPGAGKHRLCDPTDIVGMLDAAGEVRRGGDTPPPVP